MQVRSRFHYELDEVQRLLLHLSSAVQSDIGRAMQALVHNDVPGARQAIRNDDEIDTRRGDIENHVLALIAAQQPLATDLRFLLATVRIADELERMGDYAEGIARLVVRDADEAFYSPPPELLDLSDHVRTMLNLCVESFVARDGASVAPMEHRDDVVDALTRSLQNAMLDNIRLHPTTALRSLHYLFVAHNLERIGDRAINIAEQTAYIVRGSQ